MSVSTITVGGQSVLLVSTPATPGLRSIEWNMEDAVGISRSVFTGQVQAQQWPGADLLSGTATLPPLTQEQADDWESFLMQCRGMACAFQFADPRQQLPRGSGAGAPVVDNSGGTNIPGSQTLATKGWTANAQGVLRRGDWLQVDYRLYRALDDVNADGSGNAVIPIWPSLRETPTSSGSAAGWLNATGSLGYTQSRPLGNNTAAVRWSNWGLVPNRTMPADAVIQGIYPVIVASAHEDQAISYYTYGNSGASFGAVSEGHDFSVPSDPNSTSFATTEWYAASIGTSLAALAAYRIKALLNTTLTIDVMSDTATVTAVGFAVYYTSATPVTDTQIAAPFAVPAGQGLAWYLPNTVEQSGVMPGCSGIFCPSTGYATGTAITYNGGIVLRNAKGLFRLSSNKRTTSGDMTRVSRLSIPMQEYR